MTGDTDTTGEPQMTDTGATSNNKGYWSHERQEIDTGVTNNRRYWSLEPQEQRRRQELVLEPRTTTNDGATSNRR